MGSVRSASTWASTAAVREKFRHPYAKPLGIVDVDLKKLDTRRLDELKSAGGGMRV